MVTNEPPAASPRYLVVVNFAGQLSLWPETRPDSLPAGWIGAGAAGSREECLRWIAARPAAVPSPPAPAGHAGPGPVRRSTAVPCPRPTAPLRLLVFPHAGAGASAYFFLARLLQPDPVEVHVVQYPGREARMKEPPLDSLDRMIASMATELVPVLHAGPCAFFGHSMGALLAFEFTRHLRRAGAPLPCHLIISGRHAPQIPGSSVRVSQLSDEAFLDTVGRRYQALPAELLANREIRDLVLPSLRADFRLVENHVHTPGPPLAMAGTVLNGRDDPGITPAMAAAWQTHFVHPIAVRWFDGGHFFLAPAGSQLRAELQAALAGCAPRSPNG